MSGQRKSAPDELSLWMRETICRWLPKSDVWHLEDITIPVRSFLPRSALGAWYALADISPWHTRAMITSYYGDDHLELNAIFTFRRIPRADAYTDRCFAWLLTDLLLRAGRLVPPQVLEAGVGCQNVWAGDLTSWMRDHRFAGEGARLLVVIAYLADHCILL